MKELAAKLRMSPKATQRVYRKVGNFWQEARDSRDERDEGELVSFVLLAGPKTHQRNQGNQMDK